MAIAKTVPVLSCSDIDTTVDFYESLGFAVTDRQDRPYLYVSLDLDGIEVHFSDAGQSTPPGVHPAGFLIFVDDVAPFHARFVDGLRRRRGGVPATGLPRLTRLRPGQTRFSVYDPSGNSFALINFDEPDIEYGGSRRLSGLAKAHDNVRIFRDFKEDDALAARALDTALRRYRDGASRLDLARALADRAELAIALGDSAQADAARAELTAMALTPAESAELSAELTALAQIEHWVREDI